MEGAAAAVIKQRPDTNAVIRGASQDAPLLFYPSGMNNFSQNHFSVIVKAPFGAIGIRSDSSALCEMVYLPPSYETQAPRDALAEQAAGQLLRYLSDPGFHFTLPLATVGTAFQQKVWAAIAAIPCGAVLTCGANWFPLVIPCHRVTAAGGLGGFSHHDEIDGFHLGVKRWLLAHEGVKGFGR